MVLYSWFRGKYTEESRAQITFAKLRNTKFVRSEATTEAYFLSKFIPKRSEVLFEVNPKLYHNLKSYKNPKLYKSPKLL